MDFTFADLAIDIFGFLTGFEDGVVVSLIGYEWLDLNMRNY